MSEKNDDIKHDVTSNNEDTSNASQDNLKSSDSSFESKTFNVENDSGLLPAELSKAGLDAVSSLSGTMAALSQISDESNSTEPIAYTADSNSHAASIDEATLADQTKLDYAVASNASDTLKDSSVAYPQEVSKSFGLEVEPETFVNTSQVIGVASHEDDLIPASLIPSVTNEDLVAEEKSLVSSTTAGALLKKAREDANVSELSLAAQLKVSVKTLRALEADELHLLPGVAFARSLVTSICRTIKVDATEILALMPKLPQAKSEASQPKGLNLPMSGSSIDVADTFAGVGVRVFVSLIAIVLAIILVVNWSSASSSISNLSNSAAASDASASTSSELTSNSSSIAASAVASASTMVASVATSSTATPATTSASTMSGNSASTVAVSTPAPTPAPVPVVKPVASVAVTAPASVTTPAKPASVATTSASAPVAQAGQAIIVFKLTETSYLEVSEAGNKQLLGKNALKDDEVTVVAKMPIKIKVGNATATTVLVNGQIYNTAPYSKGNVARFELK